jgi:hypothetical protein
VHVGGEDGRPQRVRRRLGGPGSRQHEARDDDRGDEHEQGEREQPSHPTRGELAQRHRPGALGLAQEQPGDEVAREDEEDVDTDEAACGPAEQVVRDDEHDGERAQRLDVRAQGARQPSRCGRRRGGSLLHRGAHALPP